MIQIRSGVDLQGKKHFYLIGPDTIESFDQLVSWLIKTDSILIDAVDGFHYRMALFESLERRYKVYYHEDIGIYALSALDSDQDDWLEEILRIAVTKINN